MKKKIWRRRAVCLVVCGATLAWAPVWGKPKEGEGTRVAVVDIDRVLNNWKKAGEEKIRLEMEAREVEARLVALEKEIKALDQAAALLEGKARQDKEAESAAKKREFESVRSVHGGRLDRSQIDFLVRWYREIVDAAKACAERDGIDIVLVTEVSPEFPSGREFGNSREMEAAISKFQREVSLHKVIYARPENDITQKVIDFLNVPSDAPAK